jgi:hypothetical protein
MTPAPESWLWQRRAINKLAGKIDTTQASRSSVKITSVKFAFGGIYELVGVAWGFLVYSSQSGLGESNPGQIPS